MSNALVLFMKAPRPGTVKTRLTPKVSAVEAAELYRAFILDTLQLVQRIAGTSLFVAWTPDDGLADLRAALGNPDVEWIAQRGRHLGERMSNAFAAFFRDEWDKTVVLGGDSPLLPHAYVEEAFASLDRHDVVLGPAEDGGYYLIGLGRNGRAGESGETARGGKAAGRAGESGETARGGKAAGRAGESGETARAGKAAGRYARLFESIDWGTGRVLRQTRAAIRACGLTSHELPAWHDVDRPADLDRVAREIRALRAGGDLSTGRFTESAIEALCRKDGPT